MCKILYSMGSQKITFIMFFWVVACDSKKYDNYSLFMGIPNTEEELEFYKKLMIEYNVLYWMRPGRLFTNVEFSISPMALGKFLTDVYKKKVSLNTISNNIQSMFDKQLVKRYTKSDIETFGWTGYYRINDIYNWLEDLRIKHPDVIKLSKIGLSLEQRYIMAVKLKFEHFEPRPKVIIEGGIHAREWISPAFVTFLINVIVNAPKSENRILRDLASAYEWIFVPVLNPDGYEYSHTMDRLWKKNRHRSFGVDLNRNFDAEFGMAGVDHKFSDSYSGEMEFSEPESKAMADLVTSHRQDLKYYMAFHSFGQNILIPYEFSDQNSDNYEEVKRMCDLAVEYMSKRFESEYTVGTTYFIKGYTVSGTSTSWVKKTFKTPYVATFELRDIGMNGFVLPSEDILPTCLETLDGVCSFLGFPDCAMDMGLPGNATDSLPYSDEVETFVPHRNKGHYALSNVFFILACLSSL